MAKIFFSKKSYFLVRILQVYWEFYVDSESATFSGLQYFRRYRQWKFGQNAKNAVLWARFAMFMVFFSPNRLILVKATQGSLDQNQSIDYLYADFNAKKLFNFIQYILSYGSPYFLEAFEQFDTSYKKIIKKLQIKSL